jgi:hypothetical protein
MLPGILEAILGAKWLRGSVRNSCENVERWGKKVKRKQEKNPEAEPFGRDQAGWSMQGV